MLLANGKTEHSFELQLGAFKLDFFIRQQHRIRVKFYHRDLASDRILHISCAYLILAPSFKVAVPLTEGEALALASELLSVVASRRGFRPSSSERALLLSREANLCAETSETLWTERGLLVSRLVGRLRRV